MGFKTLILLLAALNGMHVEAATPTKMHDLKNVVWIWLENTSYADLIAQNYVRNLFQNQNMVRFSAYSPVSLVTQANAVAMIAGTDLEIKDNDLTRIFTPTLIDLLEMKSIAWRVYAEDYPGACYVGAGNETYQRYRNPFISLARIQGDRFLCGKVVGFKNLDLDFKMGGIQRFSFVIPSLIGSGATNGVESAVETLSRVIDPLLDHPEVMAETTFIISTTNMLKGEMGDQVGEPMYLSIFGNGVSDAQAGTTISTPYSHYHLLRAIEDGLALGHLNQNDSRVGPIEF